MDPAACARHAAEVLAGLPYITRHFAVRLLPEPQVHHQQQPAVHPQQPTLPLPPQPLAPAPPLLPPPAALPELLILCRASTDASSCSGVAGSGARVDGLGASGAGSAAGYFAAHSAAPAPPAPPAPQPAPLPPPPAGAYANLELLRGDGAAAALYQAIVEQRSTK